MKTIKSNITLRAAVNRVKWMRKSEYFTTRFLWKALIEVENNPMESYWDYRDEFSSEQLKKIEENGREGYYDVYNEIEENNWDYVASCYKEQREELLNEANLSDFKESFIESATQQLDDDELSTILEAFRDELMDELGDTVGDYQSFNFDLDELMSNTRYEKSLWVELTDFQDHIQDEIDAFQKAEGLPKLDLHSQYEAVYLQSHRNITDIDEIIVASESIQNKNSVILFHIKEAIKLVDRDDEIYEMVIDKDIELPISYSPIFMDSDEYKESDYISVYLMEIVTPSEENQNTLDVLMEDVVAIGFYNDDDAIIQCQVDNFCVIEANSLKDGTYETFGFNFEDKKWIERKITSLDIMRAKEIKSATNFSGCILTVDGYIITEKSA